MTRARRTLLMCSNSCILYCFWSCGVTRVFGSTMFILLLLVVVVEVEVVLLFITVLSCAMGMLDTALAFILVRCVCCLCICHCILDSALEWNKKIVERTKISCFSYFLQGCVVLLWWGVLLGWLQRQLGVSRLSVCEVLVSREQECTVSCMCVYIYVTVWCYSTLHCSVV